MFFWESNKSIYFVYIYIYLLIKKIQHKIFGLCDAVRSGLLIKQHLKYLLTYYW